MGAYLSEPITEKHSTDEVGVRLSYGASSMQGWRTSQEDAHSTILEFDEQTSFFGVFDGHGGKEVAIYTAENLPKFLKETESYKNNNMKQALIDAYLGFDQTITEQEVINKLIELSDRKKSECDESEDIEENYKDLIEEALMPIEVVMENYKKQNSLKSPYINKNKRTDEGDCSSVAACSSSSKLIDRINKIIKDKELVNGKRNDDKSQDNNVDDEKSAESKQEVDNDQTKTSKLAETEKETLKIDCEGVEGEKVDLQLVEVKDGNVKEGNEQKTESRTVEDDKQLESKTNECKKVSEETKDCDKKLENGEKAETNGISEKKGGKHKDKTKSAKKCEAAKNEVKRSLRKVDLKCLVDEDEMETESDDDSNDESFKGDSGASSDEDADMDGTVEDFDEEEIEEEEEESDDEIGCNHEEEEEDEDEDEFTRNMKEEPGSDSGCTAVVALLKGNELYVANAGDSRCVVCRNGQALEMSFDHKPENKEEMERIQKAGGRVTQDGRVNGGLNLSRAIGDHAYKQNKELPQIEQMITALPDIKHITINKDEDDFMVLACDGIWNFMSNEDVVSFVATRLKEGLKLSQICEQMFDHCLAPSTMGDGTGCDNMTAVIVKFNKPSAETKQTEQHSTSTTIESSKHKLDDDDGVESEAKRVKV